ncbi:MAG: hypothetical protein ACRC92_16285 [Peptostreptococcaceae bacterium]
MKTTNIFCSLNKKCKEEYSKEVSENILKDEEKLEELYRNEFSKKEEDK